MDNRKRYSVVVPIYGVEKYIRKCVESLIGQTYTNIEIILVDDGSKDNSPAICDEFTLVDSRVKVIHKKNGGLVSARKAGAKIATGDYILCVDGDDWVKLNYIEKFNDVIETYEPDIVCCGYIQFSEKEEILSYFPVDAGYYNARQMEKCIYPISIEDEYGRIFPPQLWAKAFKKELYVPEQLSVSDSVKIGEDGAVVKPLLCKCNSLFIIDECMYYYRNNDTSMTKNKSAYDWNGPRYVFQHLMSRINFSAYDFEKQIIRRTVRDLYTVTFSQFNNQDSYVRIKQHILANLSSPDYQEILNRCDYRGLKHNIELLLLRKQIILPIYLFYKYQSI